MVESVSPIIYQKIDTNKFAQSGKETPNQMLFYDNASKNIIQIGDESIKVFNHNASRLKKDITLHLQKDRIYKIAVNKEITFMLIFLETSKQKLVLIINLLTQRVIKILTKNLMKLIGFFFIFNSQALSVLPEDNKYFILIFNDKIEYYSITINTNGILEIVTNINTFSPNDDGNTIVQYSYNQRFMILCLQKSNNSFGFFNLSNVDFYIKQFECIIQGITDTTKKISLFKSLFSFLKIDNANEPSVPAIEQKINYVQSHFAFEAIYNKLYLLWLNYENSVVQIFQMKDMITINKVLEIQLEGDVSTMQFIDNLILLHNFDRSETTVIDLKSANPGKTLWKRYPMSSYEIIDANRKKTESSIDVKFDYKQKETKDNKEDFAFNVNLKYKYIETVSMMTYTNTSFYSDKNLKINGSIIEKKNEKNETILYNVYFDPLIYYENNYSKYESLLNLTRRKHGREVIIHGLFELIKSKKHVKKIKGIFQRIIKQIRNNSLGYHKTKKGDVSLEGKDIISNQMIEEGEISKRSITEIPIPLQYILSKKKNIVLQSDIYYKLFKSFEFKTGLNSSYIISLLLMFSTELTNNEVQIQSGFFNILILYLNKIEDFSKEAIYFQYHSIPDNTDIALFLINEIGLNKEKFIRQEIRDRSCQIGIDMLKRLEENELLFETFLKMNQYTEALFLSKKFLLDKNKIDATMVQELERLSQINWNATNNYLNY